MFVFDKENPSKIVATSLIPIVPDHSTTPMVWTVGLREISSRRVFVVCTQTRAGRSSFRFYPLPKRADKAPPAFLIAPAESPWLDDPGTHICFRHPNFVICRPLKAVYFRVKWGLAKKQIDYLPANLLTLVKHLYFKDFISDEFIDSVQNDFKRVEKILLRAQKTNFDGEAEACINKSFQLCQKIFSKCREVVNYE